MIDVIQVYSFLRKKEDALPSNASKKEFEMLGSILWAVVAILVVLWLVSFLALHITSGFIHVLLVIAVIVLLYNLFVGSRSGRTL